MFASAMGLGRGLACACLAGLALAQGASASVVWHGYLPLSDGTRLNYTLTLPDAHGRYPVVLQYDPYYAGATSDPTWNQAGYAMLGVNFRGTSCSEGVFNPTRADIQGRDGADVVAWASKQPWSDGNIAMLGFSFTGTSQISTAEWAGPALKAIMPGNVFPDLYRDIIYPGGIYQSWIAAWVATRNYVLGTAATAQVLSDPDCLPGLLEQTLPDELQTLDTSLARFIDDPLWTRGPDALIDRVHIPVLGCVNWQDTTVQSRGFNDFRYEFDPRKTWVVGGDGAHGDCPISRARRVRFLDHYLKGRANHWTRTPHVLLIHEVSRHEDPGRDLVPDNAGNWQSSFKTWGAMNKAIKPRAFFLHRDGRLDMTAPSADEPADTYRYGAPSNNTPADFGGINRYNNAATPGGFLSYTTPRLARDAEFLGSGSGDLWVSTTRTDSDIELALSEIRPDGQESFVENGWLRLSHRKLLGAGTSALRPLHSDRRADMLAMSPGVPALARIELLPFDHVFRKGSAIRLTIDTPGAWFTTSPGPATIGIEHRPGKASRLMLGWLKGARAHHALPGCAALLNQPCRPPMGPVPAGSLAIG